MMETATWLPDSAWWRGKGDKFDEAIADFSIAYADQSARHHEFRAKAVHAGNLKVVFASAKE